MKTRIWFVGAVTLSLATVATALALASNPHGAPRKLGPAALGIPVAQSQTLLTRRLVFTTDDAAGALMQLGERTLEIQHMVLGVLPDGDIGIASFTGVWNDGTTLEIAHPDDMFLRLITNLADLPGTNIADEATNERYLVDEISYCVNERGFLAVYFWSGKDSAGRRLTFGSPTGAYCCDVLTAIHCKKGSCSGSCPALAPCECDGTGNCMELMMIGCRGGCAPGHPECDTGACSGQLSNCGCH
jgi:hypothetical protein